MEHQNAQNSKPIHPPRLALFTYRSNIKPLLPSTYYDSDSGWGCVLRVTQMFLANYLMQRHQHLFSETVKLFLDNSTTAPFSIQRITESSKKLFSHKKPYEWYTPAEAGALIEDLLPKYLPSVVVSICNDNTLFKSQLRTEAPECVVLLMTRVGLDRPQPEYIPVVIDMVNNKFFAGIIGGTPKKAHYFTRNKGGKFYYLDPHKTHKCINTQEEFKEKVEEQFVGKEQSIDQKHIDPSMCIGFRFKKEEVQQFWESMLGLKSKHGSNFFLYIDLAPPQFDEDGIFVIDSDNDI